MIHRALDQSLRSDAVVFPNNILLQRTAIHADAYRNIPLYSSLENLFHSGPGTDIPGINAYLIGPFLNRVQGQLVVEMNIRYERYVYLFPDFCERLGRLLIRNGHADNLTTRLLQTKNLIHRGLHVLGFGARHRLHRYRRITPDGNLTDPNFSRPFSHHII